MVMEQKVELVVFNASEMDPFPKLQLEIEKLNKEGWEVISLSPYFIGSTSRASSFSLLCKKIKQSKA